MEVGVHSGALGAADCRQNSPNRSPYVAAAARIHGGERDGASEKREVVGFRGSALAPRRTADAPSASKLPEVDPSSQLSGFKFGRRPLELT